MILRRILALLIFAGLSVLFLADQQDAWGAQQDKNEKKEKKKGLKKKFLESKKVEETKTPEPVKPTEVKVPPRTVEAKKMDIPSFAKLIDREIDQAISKAKLPLSPSTSDAEFLRRVYLDITGVIPTPDKTQAFLESKEPNKRSKLIEELLESSNYGQRLSDTWIGLMYPVDSDNRFVNKEPLTKWLKESFNANKPWDQMVSQLLTASGEQETNPEVTYFMSNRGVDKMTDSVTKLFLGVQLQCAQCHNHPFTSWKQNEYWGMAQFFYKVNARVVRPNAKEGQNQTNAVTETGTPNRRMNPLPESAKSVPPKLLGGKEVKLDRSQPYRPVLANWLTSRDNAFFAKAMVNRMWSQFFGRGIVNPVDDMLDENAPSHPELLQALTKEFIDSGYDLKHLVRGICNTQAYQRSSKPLSENKDDKVLYTHQSMKALTPEQMFDSLTTVLGSPTNEARGPRGNFVPKGGLVSQRDRFVSFFQPGESAKLTDYDNGIPQVLRLMNSRNWNPSPAVIRELSKESKPEQAIEKIYLRTLSRLPTSDEMAKMKAYASKQGSYASAYSDILWVLLNGSEFALNR
jgi:hypothetical protein